MASLRPLCDCENLQQIVEYFAEEAWNFAWILVGAILFKS
jgi:hypothetical protein